MILVEGNPMLQRHTIRVCSFPVALCCVVAWCGTVAAEDPPDALDLPYVYSDWETFTTESTNGGLPDDHIFYVKTDGDRVWVGTEHGLALYENETWKQWQQEDGLPWYVISGIDVDPKTGDIWLALFGGGLSRFSAGRFEHWHQLNSGLVNDVVYGVAVQDDFVWAATTAGTSRFNTVTGEWDIYTEKNAPMHEIWCYNVCANDGLVYVAAWGGGVLEWNVEAETWKDYRDPDGEMEIDLFRDDGIIHVITTGVSYLDGILWASTYFGVSRYDGRHWRGYMDHDSGLASNFNNFVKAHNREGWCSTDKGLSAMMDFDTDTWVTYRKDEGGTAGSARITRGSETIQIIPMESCIPNNYVLCADFAENDDIWVGTSKGLARGRAAGYFQGVRHATPAPMRDTQPVESEREGR